RGNTRNRQAALLRGGRVAAQTPEALAKRREARKRQNEALQAWHPADMPELAYA
ncbi:MAG: hypothetical protein QOJ99_3226, partial [Bryobacterales bacterium]|nr:hypothetical protein [Bryobacterales bacterium]